MKLTSDPGFTLACFAGLLKDNMAKRSSRIYAALNCWGERWNINVAVKTSKQINICWWLIKACINYKLYNLPAGQKKLGRTNHVRV